MSSNSTLIRIRNSTKASLDLIQDLEALQSPTESYTSYTKLLDIAVTALLNHRTKKLQEAIEANQEKILQLQMEDLREELKDQ